VVVAGEIWSEMSMELRRKFGAVDLYENHVTRTSLEEGGQDWIFLGQLKERASMHCIIIS
jgi:hypothetical protein